MSRTSAQSRQCKDCKEENRPGKPRPAPYSGPRCTTHHRKYKTKVRQAARERYVARQYGVSPELYRALLADCPRNAKGQPVCPICRRCKPRALDHDHSCCSESRSCGKCARGLVCTRCNSTLGHFRDDAEAFLRAADYLAQPPAQRLRLALLAEE